MSSISHADFERVLNVERSAQAKIMRGNKPITGTYNKAIEGSIQEQKYKLTDTRHYKNLGFGG